MADPFVGEIKAISWNWAPDGWLPCDGRILQVTDYQALFSLIGGAYGGNGQTTFALPDLRGRVPVGTGQGPGLSNIQFAKAIGNESVTLTNAQVPLNAHTHQATASIPAPGSVTVNSTGSLSIPATTTSGSGSDMPGNTRILGPSTDSTVGAQVQIYSEAPANTALKPISVSVSGSVTPPTPTITVAAAGAPATSAVPLRNPELGMMYVIATVGIYPMRP